jgi:hypothetical protein
VVSNTLEGRKLHKIAIQAFGLLGIPLNAKDSDFGHVVRHLGFIINTQLLTVSIPQDKRNAILDLLASVVSKSQVTMKLYHLLIGKLIWASQVMPPARAYLSNFLALLRIAQQRRFRVVNLVACHLHDLAWFQRTLVQWDGVYLFDNRDWELSNNNVFAGDATPLFGGGVYTSTLHYSFYAFCPSCIHVHNMDSQSLEMANFLISILSIGHHASHRRILWLTDNQANVWNFAKGRSDDTFVSDCIRDIMSYAIIRQIDIRLFHCPRSSPLITPADDLSRGFHDKFESSHPSHKFVPPIVPLH